MTAALLALLAASVLLVSHPASWPIHLFRAGVFGLAIVCVLRRRRAGWSSELAVLSAAAAWATAQAATGATVSRALTLEEALGLWSWAALAFIALQVLADPGQSRRLRETAVWFGFALGITATVQCFSSGGRLFWVFPTPYDYGVMGPFVSPDHYAAFVELLLPIAAWAAFRRRRRTGFYAAACAAMFASVVAGGSRAGAAICAAEIAAVALLARAPLERAGAVAALATVFSAVAGAGFLWNRLREPDLFRYRRDLLASSIGLIQARPWTGWGLGTFEIAYPAYARFDAGRTVEHAHNDWAEWAAEGGLPFLAAMAALGVIAARRGWRTPWCLGAVALLVHGVVDYPMHKPALAAAMIVLLAAARPPPAPDVYHRVHEQPVGERA